jgi:hypothetical protein
MIPPYRQLPAALILMVSAIALYCMVVHDLCNTAMLLFFYEINSSSILFTIILFAAIGTLVAKRCDICSE